VSGRATERSGTLAEDPADLGLVGRSRGIGRAVSPSAHPRTPRTGAPRWGVDRGGDLRGPAERGVEVLGLDDVEAGEVLLRLGEVAVGGQHLAVRHADHYRSVGLVQATREAPGAARLHLPLDGSDPAAELVHLLLLRAFGGHFPLSPALRTALVEMDRRCMVCSSNGSHASCRPAKPLEAVEDEVEPELELVREVVSGFRDVFGDRLGDVGILVGGELAAHALRSLC
jgi:hypothetical protein